MKYLNSLLKVKKIDRSFIQIILWWEIRRILYNLIVLFCGILSIVIMVIAAMGRVELEPGEDLFEPFMIFVFAFLCNVGYTLGWITEVSMKRSLDYGPKMFKVGLYFTLFFVFLPTLIWVLVALVEEINNLF